MKALFALALALFAGPVTATDHPNGSQTSPNPGIEALGFTLGPGWRF